MRRKIMTDYLKLSEVSFEALTQESIPKSVNVSYTFLQAVERFRLKIERAMEDGPQVFVSYLMTPVAESSAWFRINRDHDHAYIVVPLGEGSQKKDVAFLLDGQLAR